MEMAVKSFEFVCERFGAFCLHHTLQPASASTTLVVYGQTLYIWQIPHVHVQPVSIRKPRLPSLTCLEKTGFLHI